jgi:hypothetical protein
MVVGVAAAAAAGELFGLAGMVRCCQCGKPCRGGATDWHGRFRCEDCARLWEGVERSRRQQQAQALETERLASVAAEEAERGLMWAMHTPPA